MTQQPNPPLGGDEEKVVARPRYVVVPLSCAPYPPAFLDAINGFATGGSGRCLEAIEEEGAWIEALAAPVLPVEVREAVKHLRECVKLVPAPGAIDAAEQFLSTIKGDA